MLMYALIYIYYIYEMGISAFILLRKKPHTHTQSWKRRTLIEYRSLPKQKYKICVHYVYRNTKKVENCLILTHWYAFLHYLFKHCVWDVSRMWFVPSTLRKKPIFVLRANRLVFNFCAWVNIFVKELKYLNIAKKSAYYIYVLYVCMLVWSLIWIFSYLFAPKRSNASQ